MKRFRPRRNRGFTLIEVLLVLVILVILASLATVNILSSRKKAQLQQAKIQVELLDRALEHYILDVGTYPSSLQGLRTRPADIPDPEKWAGPYLSKEVPADPWDKPYQYLAGGGHNGTGKPDVWTVSPENKEIGNWEEQK
ncbi:MAG: type II secretion system major pseudopilin GspG [Thermoguttaceae bacterium]